MTPARAAADGDIEQSHRPIAYRADIDGLRAIAVLSVVFFHFGFTLVPGGFVGVDIFFVISGFLITSQLLQSLDGGRFSFADFYERRIRRLLPALVPVLVFAIGVASWKLPPRELIDFSDSLFAFCLFASNFFFMGQESYFAGSSTLAPLLHTWSLSVEEQYYLVFPAVLLLMHRTARRHTTCAIALLLLASFAFSCFAVAREWTNIAFYHPASRFWELLIGSMLATGTLNIRMSDRVATVVGSLCIGVLLASFVFISKATPFPGVAALAPTLATAGLILCGQHNTTAVTRLLALRAPVFIGKISYSLYLWHWPLLALVVGTAGVHPGPIESVALIGASIALASLSYFFVEQPLRSRRVLRERRGIFAALATAIIAFGAVAIAGRATDGLPTRFPLDIAHHAAQVDRERNWSQFRYGTCFLGFSGSLDDFENNGCLRTDPARPNVLILGDSHAAQLYYGLKKRFPDVNFLQVTSFSCTPSFESNGATRICEESNRHFLGGWLEDHAIDGLILGARWEDAAQIDGVIQQLNRFESLPAQVALVGPGPRLERTLNPIDLLAPLENMNDAERTINEKLRAEPFVFDETFARALTNRSIRYISLLDTLCEGRYCRQFDENGAPILLDNNHLTIEGSAAAAKAFDEFIARLQHDPQR